jgi:hypothetical protein
VTLWQKIALVCAVGLTGKNAVAAATTGAVAATVAVSTGADPLPWALGAFGAAVVYAYRRPDDRAKALVNFGISVLIGGLVAPWAAATIRHQFGTVWGNDYVMALVMSAAWPWLIPAAFSLYERVAGRK